MVFYLDFILYLSQPLPELISPPITHYSHSIYNTPNTQSNPPLPAHNPILSSQLIIPHYTTVNLPNLPFLSPYLIPRTHNHRGLTIPLLHLQSLSTLSNPHPICSPPSQITIPIYHITTLVTILPTQLTILPTQLTISLLNSKPSPPIYNPTY